MIFGHNLPIFEIRLLLTQEKLSRNNFSSFGVKYRFKASSVMTVLGSRLSLYISSTSFSSSKEMSSNCLTILLSNGHFSGSLIFPMISSQGLRGENTLAVLFILLNLCEERFLQIQFSYQLEQWKISNLSTFQVI
jgi:hypothetical protein